MLSILTYGPLGQAADGPASDLDPGILSLVARIIRSWRDANLERHERSISSFIAASGSQMSDDIERRIGAGLTSGRF